MDTEILSAACQLASRSAGEGWRDLALCAETDPEAFFPEKGGSAAEAKRVCAMCDVRPECLQFALDHWERFGVWGGLTERERHQLARQPNPVRRCPKHGATLSGGPILYHCAAGRHSVTAADLQDADEAAMMRRVVA